MEADVHLEVLDVVDVQQVPEELTGPQLVVLARTAAGRAKANHKYLKALGANIEQIVAFYDADTMTATVPGDVYKEIFRRKDLDMEKFNKGLAGMVKATVGTGHAKKGVTMVFNKAGLLDKGRVLATEVDLTAKFVCNVHESDCHCNWEGQPGFHIKTFCPTSMDPSRPEENVKTGILTGDAVDLVQLFRERHASLEGAEASAAKASAIFAIQKNQVKGSWFRATLLRAWFDHVIVDILIRAGNKNHVVTVLKESNTEAWVWEIVKDKKGLLNQLAEVAKVIVLQKRLDEEIKALGSSRNDRRRGKNLRTIGQLLGKVGMAAHLIEWVREYISDNNSRAGQARNNEEPGPPKYKVRTQINSISLFNRDMDAVAQFLDAVGICSTIYGALRDGPTMPRKKDSYAGRAVSTLSHVGSDGRVATRAYLIPHPQLRSVAVKGGPLVSWNACKWQMVVPFGFRVMTTFLRFTYNVPVAPRVDSCLGPNGASPVVSIDFGGRNCSSVLISCPTNNPNFVRVQAFEVMADLSQTIIKVDMGIALVKSSIAKSRIFRLNTTEVQLLYKNLLAKEEAAAAADTTLPPAKRRHLGVLRAHGFGRTPWRSELLQMEELEEGEEADMDQLELNYASEILEDFKVPLMEAKQKEAMQDVAMEMDMGPLWTPEVHERYKKHCAMRKAKNVKELTQNQFLRRNVEKRLNRQQKGIAKRLRAQVYRAQNQALQTMIPKGTSIVLAPRLNFHTFGRLAKCVKRYFGYLSLAYFHTRLRRHCTNGGAVCLNVCEGKTTKKCLSCNKDLKIGGAKIFKCKSCKLELPRDGKVGRVEFFFGVCICDVFFCVRRRLRFSFDCSGFSGRSSRPCEERRRRRSSRWRRRSSSSSGRKRRKRRRRWSS